MGTRFKNYRDESRIQWGVTQEVTEPLEHSRIELGAVLRIADAVELLSKNWIAIIDDRDRYKKQCEEMRIRSNRYYRRISALRGVITRLKNKSKHTSESLGELTMRLRELRKQTCRSNS